MPGHRIALVTGGGSGIGAAIAEGLAADGATVVVADRDGVAAKRVADRIGGVAVEVDITSPDQVTAMMTLFAPPAVPTRADRLGGPGILVNNAGVVAGGGPLVDLPVEVFDQVMAVNLRGTFLVTQAVARAMIAVGAGGSIVNISSIGAVQPTPASATTRRPRPRSTPSPDPRRSSWHRTGSGSTRSPRDRSSPR